jgi:hypothetical protein
LAVYHARVKACRRFDLYKRRGLAEKPQKLLKQFTVLYSNEAILRNALAGALNLLSKKRQPAGQASADFVGQAFLTDQTVLDRTSYGHLKLSVVALSEPAIDFRGWGPRRRRASGPLERSN